MKFPRLLTVAECQFLFFSSPAAASNSAAGSDYWRCHYTEPALSSEPSPPPSPPLYAVIYQQSTNYTNHQEAATGGLTRPRRDMETTGTFAFLSERKHCNYFPTSLPLHTLYIPTSLLWCSVFTLHLIFSVYF